MARAKSTRRAEARRRYRAAQAAERAAEEEEQQASEELETASEERQPSRTPFRLPDVRGDLVALPGIVRARPIILVPLVLMLVAFGLTFIQPPSDGTVQFILQFYISSFLYPAILAMFLGGVLAPRGSYLIGLFIGVVNALLVVARSLIGTPTGAEPPSALATGALQVIVLLAFYGLAIGAFAGWYRDFLRRNAARNRAMREAREKQKRREARRGVRATR